jgi:outer membrane protein TolC
VKRTQYQLELSQARHKAGMVTRADVLRAKTQRAEAELLDVQARNALKIVHGRLARNMGLSVSTVFEVREVPTRIQREEISRVEQLLVEAAQQRPELKAALAHIESSRAELAIVRSDSWPKLTAKADAGRKDTEFVPEREEWSVGLSASYSLFDGLERSHRRRRAHAELASAIAEHADLLRGIELEVWTAYWRLMEAGEAMEAAAALTASAGESARLAEGEYRSGVTSIVGLIDAQTTQTEAERRLVQSRLDWHTAKTRFERAVGRSLARKTNTVVHEERK